MINAPTNSDWNLLGKLIARQEDQKTDFDSVFLLLLRMNLDLVKPTTTTTTMKKKKKKKF